MPSGVVYANPFGAAAEGQRYGIEEALRLGNAARQFRNEDQNYDFLRWYEPYKRNEAAYHEAIARQQAYQAALQGATRAGIASGNFDPANAVNQQYYGIQPQGARTPDATQNGLAYAAFDPLLSVGDVYRTPGGMRYGQQGMQQPMTPQQAEEEQARHEYAMRLYGQGARGMPGSTGGGVNINPIIQGAPPPLPGAAPAPTPVAPMAFPNGGPPTTNYGMPSPMTHVGPKSNSIWADERQPNIGGVSM